MKVRHALAATAAVASMAAVNPQAGAATTVGGCTASPGYPYITYVNGVKHAAANIYVKCTTGRSGIAVGQIREHDPGSSDDDVTPERSFSFTIPAGQTHRVGTVMGRCDNFDVGSNEELFTRAKVNVLGINSSWVQTPTLSASC